MRMILIFAKRNLKIFFRDKTSVFFSLLSVFIIIGLYALFLGDIQVKSIKVPNVNAKVIRFLVDSWIMAGLIAVNTVTVTLGAFAVMVQDESKKIMKDFRVAPIKRSQLVASYVLSSWAIGLIMTISAFIVGEAYIVLSGGQMLSIEGIMKVLGIIVLCVFSSSAIVFLLVSFIKSDNAFATLSTLVGTLIGFTAGVYVPVGVLPDAVQTFMKFVPISHGAALLRQTFMEKPLDLVFHNAPKAVLDAYKHDFGIELFWNKGIITPLIMVSILAGVGVLFFVISVIRTSKYKSK